MSKYKKAFHYYNIILITSYFFQTTSMVMITISSDQDKTLYYAIAILTVCTNLGYSI